MLLQRAHIVRASLFMPCSTNAAWCMTGHILGLGDRHGENIMIDTHSGETVHVDFGCLFDRGLILAVSAGKVGLRFVPGYYLSVGM